MTARPTILRNLVSGTDLPLVVTRRFFCRYKRVVALIPKPFDRFTIQTFKLANSYFCRHTNPGNEPSDTPVEPKGYV